MSINYVTLMEFADVNDSVSNPQDTHITHVDIVDVIDKEGNPWEPVPGPDPWDELAIAENGGANLVGTNVYEIGQVVTGKTAVFIGGNPETTTYRSRWQSRVNSQESWVNSNWLNTTNEKTDHDYTILNPGQLRFQSQGRDTSVDPVLQVNSFTSVKDVPFTEIGTVAVSPDAASVAVMGSQTFTVVVTGGDATDLTYKWNVRSGSAQIDTPDNQATATYTFIGAGQTQIQCTVYSANSSNSPLSNLAMVIVT